MTASTDFLPFATGAGANVEAQATWASDAVVPNGFSAGLASSAKFNKALRQGAFGTAALATWISQELNQNIPDDGNLAGFVTNLTAAFMALLTSKFPGSIAANGYQTLPGGLIVQWGTYSGTTAASGSSGIYESGAITVPWAEAFPNHCFGVIGGAYDIVGSGFSEQAWFSPSPSLTSGVGWLACRAASQAMTGFFIAIGN